jgi:hypothetical protein
MASVNLDEQLQIAVQNKQKAFYKKDNRGFNFWVTQIELIKTKMRMT